MDNPTQHISYEMLDPAEEFGREFTTDRSVARKAYNRGFLVSEHEVVVTYTSTGQKITTTLTTEWKEQ